MTRRFTCGLCRIPISFSHPFREEIRCRECLLPLDQALAATPASRCAQWRRIRCAEFPAPIDPKWETYDHWQQQLQRDLDLETPLAMLSGRPLSSPPYEAALRKMAFFAAAHGRTWELRYLIQERHLSVELYHSITYASLLHFAVGERYKRWSDAIVPHSARNVSSIQYLLSSGAKITVPDAYGNTALDVCVSPVYLDILHHEGARRICRLVMVWLPSVSADVCAVISRYACDQVLLAGVEAGEPCALPLTPAAMVQ